MLRACLSVCQSHTSSLRSPGQRSPLVAPLQCDHRVVSISLLEQLHIEKRRNNRRCSVRTAGLGFVSRTARTPRKQLPCTLTRGGTEAGACEQAMPGMRWAVGAFLRILGARTNLPGNGSKRTSSTVGWAGAASKTKSWSP